MEVRLEDYILGGYLLVKDRNRADWLAPPPPLPEKLISLSKCINQHFETLWGWTLENHQAAIATFGIPPEKFAFFHQWSQSNDESDVYGVFYQLEDAQAFVHEIFALTDNTPQIIGMGLPKQFASKFIEDNRTLDYPGGVFELLRKPQSLAAGGKILGFEIVSYGVGGIGHSWLCGSLHREMYQAYGIQPNDNGLIDSPAQAMQVYEWIAEDKQQGHRAEPEPYYPWLLIQYPHEASSNKP